MLFIDTHVKVSLSGSVKSIKVPILLLFREIFICSLFREMDAKQAKNFAK